MVGFLHAGRVGSAQKAGGGGDDISLTVEDDLPLRHAQVFGVVQQGDVAGGRGFVFGQKSAHQLVQGGAVVEFAALRGGFDLANHGQQALGVAVQQVKQNGFFGAVVVVKPRFGRATGRRNIVHAGGGVTGGGKTGGGMGQNVFTPLLKAVGSGSGHGAIMKEPV